MRTLKIFKGAIVTLMLTLLIGCSDGLVSPLSSEKNPVVDNSNTELNRVPANEFQTVMTFKPGQSYTFRRNNTGINIFHTLSIKDSYKKGVEAIGYYGDIAFILNTDMKKFSATSITVQNQSQYVQELDIYLSGEVEYIDPGVKDVKSE